MFQIDDKLVSTELFEKSFICDLPKCLGNCCVYGDSGAPLSNEEAALLESEFQNFVHNMSEKGKATVNELGKWVIDFEGDKVTPLNDRKECAYVYFENKIAFCAIEKSYQEGRTLFQKPLSCHLYPIRLSRLGNHMALNYHHWPVCDPARVLGRAQSMPVFRFLKVPIIRAFGEEFYNELEKVFMEYKKGFAV